MTFALPLVLTVFGMNITAYGMDNKTTATDYAPSECEYSVSTCRCAKLTENRAANILIEMYEQCLLFHSRHG